MAITVKRSHVKGGAARAAQDAATMAHLLDLREHDMGFADAEEAVVASMTQVMVAAMAERLLDDGTLAGMAVYDAHFALCEIDAFHALLEVRDVWGDDVARLLERLTVTAVENNADVAWEDAKRLAAELAEVPSDEQMGALVAELHPTRERLAQEWHGR